MSDKKTAIFIVTEPIKRDGEKEGEEGLGLC